MASTLECPSQLISFELSLILTGKWSNSGIFADWSRNALCRPMFLFLSYLPFGKCYKCKSYVPDYPKSLRFPENLVSYFIMSTSPSKQARNSNALSKLWLFLFRASYCMSFGESGVLNSFICYIGSRRGVCTYLEVMCWLRIVTLNSW